MCHGAGAKNHKMRKCWNWQTGKTKDLVLVLACGFKSHLPQCLKRARNLINQRFLAFFMSENRIILCSLCSLLGFTTLFFPSKAPNTMLSVSDSSSVLKI